MAKSVLKTEKIVRQPAKRPGVHAKRPNKRFDDKKNRGQGR